MARLVAAFGTSHSLMLTAELDDWRGRFVGRDRAMRHADPDGNWRSYDELLEAAPPDAAARIDHDLLGRRYADVTGAMERLDRDVADAALDALIVIGDDQKELFQDWNMPAVGIYTGETIRNAKRGDMPDDWAARARLRRLEEGGEVDYPCHPALALHLVDALQRSGFDLSVMRRLADGQAEGHAYSHVHRFCMGRRRIPVVPVFLNAYFPPNQPSPARCFALGQAIAQAVPAFGEDVRVGIIASGGLSHFLVDEPFDRQFIDALRRKDAEYLRGVGLHKLLSGSGEMRNWICLAGALGDMDLAWCSYTPGYRTPALTGTGLCFAAWH